jgi:hypothetical protein
MATTVVNEAVARPVRGLVQMVPAGVVTEFVDAFIHDLSEQQYAALFGLLTLVFGLVQVLIENYAGKGFLRRIPPTEVPVVDGGPADGGQVEGNGGDLPPQPLPGDAGGPVR